MPIKKCNENGKPGYKYGNNGHCYTYIANDEQSRKNAVKKAAKQGVAIEGPDKFAAIQKGESKGTISYKEFNEILLDIITDDESTLEEITSASVLYGGDVVDEKRLTRYRFYKLV